MASAPLRLFPTVSADQPLKSSLKKSRVSSSKTGPSGLKGVLQADTTLNTQPTTKSAPETIKHSLFCDPSPEILASISQKSSKQSLLDSNDSPSTEPSRSETRLRRKPSGVHSSPLTGSEISFGSDVDEPQSRLVQSKTHSSPSTKQSSRLKQKKIPTKHSAQVQTATNKPSEVFIVDEDRISPLPHRTQFTPRPRLLHESPPSTTSQNMSPSSGRSAISSPDPSLHIKKDSQPMRSMFPQYDHSKSLSQQQYFPKTRGQPPTSMSNDKIRNLGGPDEKRTLKHCDSAVGLFNGYEHVPAAEVADLQDIWNSSCSGKLVTGRKVQLSLHQFSAQGTALAIGRNGDELMYCMDRIDTQSTQQNPSHPKEMAVKKHHPTQDSSLPVAHLLLPDRALVRTAGKPLVSIFPQAAAIDAIESLLTTSKAKEIESLDGGMRSPTAARFAHGAIAVAQRHHCCDLVRKARRRDSLGSVTAAYELRHPKLGAFVINVTKSYSPASPTVPRAKISLHHPSATPTAVAAETLNLAFLDFARDACVLDLPGLLTLDDRYVVDTVVTALLAVAVIENDTLVAEALVFDAPPKVAISDTKQKHQGTRLDKSASRSRFSRSKMRKSKKSKETTSTMGGEQVELPMLTQGALALLGLSFKAAVLLLNAGVKVTADVIVGASNAARKL